MAKHYQLQDDNGELTLFRMELEKPEKPHGHSHWEMFGTVPPEEYPPALAIGEKVMEVIRDDQEIDDNAGVVHPGHAEQGGPEFLRIWLKDKVPLPITGHAYLKSLPDRTFIRCCSGPESDYAIVTDHGIHRVGVGQFIRWEDIDTLGDSWILKASADNCPPWLPSDRQVEKK